MSFVVHCTNLADEAEAVDIRKFFAPLHIPNGCVQIIGGRHGHCYVGFNDRKSAADACQMSGAKLCGHELFVRESNTKELEQHMKRIKNGIDSDEDDEPTPSSSRVYPSHFKQKNGANLQTIPESNNQSPPQQWLPYVPPRGESKQPTPKKLSSNITSPIENQALLSSAFESEVAQSIINNVPAAQAKPVLNREPLPHTRSRRSDPLIAAPPPTGSTLVQPSSQKADGALPSVPEVYPPSRIDSHSLDFAGEIRMRPSLPMPGVQPLRSRLAPPTRLRLFRPPPPGIRPHQIPDIIVPIHRPVIPLPVCDQVLMSQAPAAECQSTAPVVSQTSAKISILDRNYDQLVASQQPTTAPPPSILQPYRYFKLQNLPMRLQSFHTLERWIDPVHLPNRHSVVFYNVVPGRPIASECVLRVDNNDDASRIFNLNGNFGVAISETTRLEFEQAAAKYRPDLLKKDKEDAVSVPVGQRARTALLSAGDNLDQYRGRHYLMMDNIPYRASGVHITAWLAKGGIAQPKSFHMIPPTDNKPFSGIWFVECQDRRMYEDIIMYAKETKELIMDRIIYVKCLPCDPEWPPIGGGSNRRSKGSRNRMRNSDRAGPSAKKALTEEEKNARIERRRREYDQNHKHDSNY